MSKASTKPKILLQIDGDNHASMFDAVVAVDSGVDHLIQQHNVSEDEIEGLVHGAIFTRGAKDLPHTAIFVGGSDVTGGERLLRRVTESFVGPMRVSVMLDANGANTTAAAAVLSVARHLDLSRSVVTVLAATGPVGQRAALLAALEGADVRLASRRLERAEMARETLLESAPDAKLTPFGVMNEETTIAAMQGADVVIAAGAAGVELVSRNARSQVNSLRVLVDLNAVPPLGVVDVDVTAKAEMQGDVACYGAIGVGGLKMKIHKASIARLFETNDAVLDAVEIFKLGKSLLGVQG